VREDGFNGADEEPALDCPHDDQWGVWTKFRRRFQQVAAAVHCLVNLMEDICRNVIPHAGSVNELTDGELTLVVQSHGKEDVL
jgi:hypothetical protein